ncbi:MAG: hydantoinase/oxoprolinase family protein [Ardenticatenaceae bacterium]
MVDRNIAVPLYEQVRNWILEQVQSGAWSANFQIPAEPKLAKDLGVSRSTVRQALGTLEQSGLVTRIAGRGTFVNGTTGDAKTESVGRLQTADQASVKPLVLGIDAGGTMTDTFIVDEEGRFTVGKAGTTPHDESIGFIASTEDALAYWGLDLDTLFTQLDVTLYSGTALLNTLLTYTGRRLGLLITRGFEEAVMMGRGLQVWAGYNYEDRLHAVTHKHPKPLVPRRRIQGVTERVDHFGEMAIPLYEHEVVNGVRRLVKEGIEALCICFLFAHVNPDHENRAHKLAKQTLAELGVDIPIYLSSDIRPVVREQSRLNSLLIEAYAAAPGRKQLLGVERAIHQHGFRFPLQTVLSYGGLADIRYPRLHETLISGPVGGILGAQYVGQIIGADNIVVSDMGGTSFDIGAITGGVVPIDNEPTLARFKLNLPTIAMDTIGAGGGTIIKVDPVTKRINLGPESAGSDPGPVSFGRGGTEPTITDCDLVLGYLNPDYFLGGNVRLDVEKAATTIREKVTDVVGIDLYEGCEGIIRLLEAETRDALSRVVGARGLNPADYILMSYGGAGPLHMAGYSRGLGFKGVMTFPFAAAFSAFGCTTADYLHRHSRSVQLALPHRADSAIKSEIGQKITAVWSELVEIARDEMKREGHDVAKVDFQPLAMMRYGGQLEDIEVESPLIRVANAAQMDQLITAFETLYEKINRRVGKYPEAGYEIMELGLLARIDKVKPRFSKQPLGKAQPVPEANRGKRQVYMRGQWLEAQLWEVDLLQPGNRIQGPAILEHPATTMVLYPDNRLVVDEWNFFWLY